MNGWELFAIHFVKNLVNQENQKNREVKR